MAKVVPHIKIQEPIRGIGERTGRQYFRAGEVPEQLTFTPMAGGGAPPAPMQTNGVVPFAEGGVVDTAGADYSRGIPGAYGPAVLFDPTPTATGTPPIVPPVGDGTTPPSGSGSGAGGTGANGGYNWGNNPFVQGIQGGEFRNAAGQSGFATQGLPFPTPTGPTSYRDYYGGQGGAWDKLLTAHGINPGMIDPNTHVQNILSSLYPDHWQTHPFLQGLTPKTPNVPAYPGGSQSGPPVAFDNGGTATMDSGYGWQGYDNGGSTNAPQAAPTQPSDMGSPAPSYTPLGSPQQTASQYASQGITGSSNLDQGPDIAHPNGIHNNQFNDDTSINGVTAHDVQNMMAQASQGAGAVLNHGMSLLGQNPNMDAASAADFAKKMSQEAGAVNSGQESFINGMMNLSQAYQKIPMGQAVAMPWDKPAATIGTAVGPAGQTPHITPPNAGTGGLLPGAVSSPTGRTTAQIQADPNGYASPEEREWFLNQVGKTTVNHDGIGDPILLGDTPPTAATSAAPPINQSRGSGTGDWSNWGDAGGHLVGWAANAGYTANQMVYQGQTGPFDPAVEAMRPLVAQYFAPEDVDHALWVMNRESKGNPAIVNDDSKGSMTDPSVVNGGISRPNQAIGLFQVRTSSGIPQGGSAEQQIANAAKSVYHK